MRPESGLREVMPQVRCTRGRLAAGRALAQAAKMVIQ
jgi:hypothetical protein